MSDGNKKDVEEERMKEVGGESEKVEKQNIDSLMEAFCSVSVEEATAAAGWGADIVSAMVAEHFGKLKAAPHRITLPDAPVPYSGVLEARYLPSAAYIAEQVDTLVSTNQPPLPWWRNAA